MDRDQKPMSMAGIRAASREGPWAEPRSLRWLLMAFLLAASPLHALSFTVTSSGDAPDAAPGDTLCQTAGAVCTLRAAIQEANALGGAHTINFNIAPLAPIVLVGPLPFVSSQLTIDGTTQPEFVNAPPYAPVVELSAAACGGFGALDLRSGSSSSTIRGLIIHSCASSAIRILGQSNCVIAGNFLGTNAAGTGPGPGNGVGVYIGGSVVNANGNRIGGTNGGVDDRDRNVISGNTTDGIQLNGGSGGTSNTVVENNYIGVDVTGTLPVPNTFQGIALFTSFTNTGNMIGGTAANAGNLISGNGNDGILIADAGTTGTLVRGNLIGTDFSGTAPVPNLRGVEVTGGTTLNTIGGAVAGMGNVISGNTNEGILISSAASNTVQKNRIGTDVNGTAPLANGQSGIQLQFGASSNVIGGASGVGNVISSNGVNGVNILHAGSSLNRVAGNLIGTDLTGTADLGNTFVGVAVALGATDNIIGEVGGANVISGNNQHGVRIVDAGTNDNLVQLNLIGLDAGGSVALPNGADGVRLEAGGAASGNVIGGAGLGNVISGNDGAGIRILNSITSTSIVDNTIGRNIGNTGNVPNPGGGVRIENSSGNTVGGLGAADGNIIGGNSAGSDGVAVVGAATGNAILRNAIFSNGGLGIDLGDDGVTANDVGDGDFGANDLQNFPVLSAVTTDGAGNVHIAGSLNTVAGVASYRIEFFAHTAPDPTGHGEALRYLGFQNVTTDVGGNAVIGLSLPAVVNAPADYVTATATDASDNTSEFSANLDAVGDLVVTTTADTVDGVTTSVANLIANPGADGRISLREAIQATNADAGVTDTIRFGIPLSDAGHVYYQDDSTPSSLSPAVVTALADADISDFDPDYPAGFARSWYRIQPNPQLPSLDDGVIVDADTQPGHIAGGPVVEIDGSGGGGASAFSMIRATLPSIIRGFVIHGFTNQGLAIRGDEGGHLITGNYIGTDVSGTMGIGAGTQGIFLGETGFSGTSTPVTIGGDSLAERNIISSNPSRGIYLWAFGNPGISEEVRIQGNYIGTDVTGTVALGGQNNGITAEFSGGHLIGGPNPGEGNVISGNLVRGIELNGHASGSGTDSDASVIENNLIGVDSTGIAPLGNGERAIIMFATSSGSVSDNIIRGNVIAASAAGWDGIRLSGNGDRNAIDSNFIGTDATGMADLGNTGNGIHISSIVGFEATENIVRNNVIRFNDLDGVRIVGDGSVVTLAQNQISSNDGLGIDLEGDGVTLNDIGVDDIDTGSNTLLNYPFMQSPVETAGVLNVNYALDTAVGWYRVEFFKNAVGADASGYGEGQTFVSSVVVNHPGGVAGYSHSFAGSAGEVVSATATLCTDMTLACTAPASTSEFNRALAAVTTAVELYSFTALGDDESVALEWRTASELNNLGFHLYRSLSPDGLWTRITPSLIPGLGSSPEGASYSFRDTGLQNGTTYYYRLEDIDSTSGSTLHGPVSATPSASAPEDEGEGDPEGEDGGESPDPESPPEKTAHGSSGKPSLRVLSRNARAMVVELTTPGFVATTTSAGVRVSVRGFDARRHPEDPALPLKRALLNGIVGRHARIVWAREKALLSFPDLIPAAVGSPEVFVGTDGTVQPRRREMAFAPTDGLHPGAPAWIAGDAFIGRNKKFALELNPLRYDASSRHLHLATKLQVKIAFDREASVPEDGAGSEGVRPPSSTTRGGGRVLAHLHTLEKGLHAIPYEALGFRKPVPRKALRLSLQGQVVPHRIEPASQKRFGPGSVLYFYAAHEASSLDHSSETTYALETSSGGVLMRTVAGSLKGLRPVSQAPHTEARFEANRFYQAGLLDAPDIWLWDFVVGGMSKSFPFVLSGLDSSSPEPVRLQMVLQGASEAQIDGEHHLSVSVNGVPLGETTFDGKLAHVFTTAVPVSAFLEGENTLEVTNLGDKGAYSFVFLDRFSVVHPRTRTLKSGRFEGTFSQKGRVSLPSAARYGMDVTDPRSPKWVKLHKTRARRTFKAQAGHRYVVASKGGLLSPRVSRPLETDLRESWNQADYVLIAPARFLEAAQPLLQRREDQGLQTRAVSFEEIVSQFGYGRPSAQAIREFVAHAYHHWEAPRLKYVLLLGDASYDPRNFTGFSKGSPLPAMWAKTSYLVTSADPLIGAVNGEDGLADVAIGRLPALTLEEAETLVRKVLAWEDEGLDLGGKAIMVADNPDIAGDFEWDLQDIRGSFLTGRDTETIHLRDHGAATRTEVLNALDQGASLLSYVGHGGPAVWASENVLNSWDPPKLLRQPEQPLMLTFNCLNGYFVAPNYDSLAEAFMKAEGKGTIGAFSPSGLSLDGPAHQFHRAFMNEIVNGAHERLGDAVLATQGAYAETGLMPELLAVYHLFGDPALRLRR